jgi:benzoate membrane transport protein
LYVEGVEGMGHPRSRSARLNVSQFRKVGTAALMLTQIEQPTERPPGVGRIVSDFGILYASNGFIGWLFAVTAPVAIILAVGSGGGLSESEIASWIFGVFFFNGLITLLFSWLYRQPLVFFWTIPGTVIIGQSLTHLTFPEVVGAFYATGVLMLVLGVSGWVKRVMQLVPMPIVMGMVAGVFLRFGLELVRAVFADSLIVAPMVAVWLILAAAPRLGRRIPPIIGALVVGASMTILFSRFDATATLQLELIRPVIQKPVWSIVAMVELVVPLAITVLVVQNGQGFAVLKAAGHTPPINAVTMACGIGSVISAAVGGVSSCLTGPTNAIVVSSGEQKRHYSAAMFVGCLALVFGLLAPTFTRLLLLSPKSLVMALAGLAMLRVLQTAFVTAFKDRFSLGALLAFLVTVADVPLLNVGAAFWGLVAGFAISWLLERSDFAAEAKS